MSSWVQKQKSSKELCTSDFVYRLLPQNQVNIVRKQSISTFSNKHYGLSSKEYLDSTWVDVLTAFEQLVNVVSGIPSNKHTFACMQISIILLQYSRHPLSFESFSHLELAMAIWSGRHDFIFKWLRPNLYAMLSTNYLSWFT